MFFVAENFRYWMYAHESEILVIKSPEEKVDGKSNKKAVTAFLGYEWKKRKSKEGIHYISKIQENEDNELNEDEQAAIVNINSINYIQTPLYNPLDVDDNKKICYLIKKKLEGENVDIPSIYADDSGKNPSVSSVSLVDMLDFDKPEFDASITIGSRNKLVHFDSDYETNSINKLSLKVFAGGDKPDDFVTEQSTECCFPVIGNGTSNEGILGYTKTSRISEKCITLSARGTVGYSLLRNQPFTPIVRLIVIVCDESKIITEYLDYFLKAFNIGNTGSVIPQLTVPYVKKVKIPKPPIDIQEQLVKKCNIIKNNFESGAFSEVEYFNKLKDFFIKNRVVIL